MRCRVDGVKGCASPPSPQRCSSCSPGVPGGGRGTFARCPPRDEAASKASRATPSAVQGDAARGAIGADRARIIDRRDSVVTAEPDEERLLLRAMATSRKCVLARAVSTTLASRRRRPYLLLIPRTWRLELRRRESSLRPYNRPSPASRRVQLAKPPNVETSPRQNPWVPTGLMHRFSPRRHPLLAQAH